MRAAGIMVLVLFFRYRGFVAFLTVGWERGVGSDFLKYV